MAGGGTQLKREWMYSLEEDCMLLHIDLGTTLMSAKAQSCCSCSRAKWHCFSATSKVTRAHGSNTNATTPLEAVCLTGQAAVVGRNRHRRCPDFEGH